ncbi:FAD-dependent oxidoreductase [Rhodobacter ferrooxidans]|uniref:FAD dependent oxidoreductase n=1 Tax=Rhodobacter ferrooxidans TaxID=371731 RepID=C8S289_9RHOB|nr:FAD-dependent oxidoreductase [Rhodobacter sp. SW2]EEW24961.1 FAD dependent oxidoreductase [Rhodobacter sp. SW2]
MQIPSSAEVVIIGGGVIGASIAYHLTKMGVRDVLVLERDRLTSGTTWHAAGLITTMGASDTLHWITSYSRDLYARLEAETGVSTGFQPVGYLQLAADKVRQQVQRREMNFARLRGCDKHEISPREALELFPLLEPQGLLSALYSPQDGRANPVDVTMSLVAGARQGGARFVEGVSVQDFILRNGRVAGVETSAGPVLADRVILAAGMWSRQIAARAGVPLPLQAAEHYYLLTEPIAGVRKTQPIVEDAQVYTYVREEGGGWLFGLFEPQGACWRPDGIPTDASFADLPPDWDRLTPFLEAAFQRFPAMQTAGIKKLFCGPESFTPDVAPLIGESPEVPGLFIATGMNSLGILSAGGIGHIVAEWVISGNPGQDITALDVARTPVHEASRSFLEARIPDALGDLFNHASLPDFEHQSARNIRLSPLHRRLEAAGARFTTLSGWEVPKWFSPDPALTDKGCGFGRPRSFEVAAAEHLAVRHAAGLFDKSFMAKFIVEGADALAVLNRVSAARITSDGRNVYTQWLKPNGGIVADLTVTALARSRFLLVGRDASQRFLPSWLARHTQPGEACIVQDVTSAYAILSLQGPQSRAILQRVARCDLTVPYRGSFQIEVGPVRVLGIRITYAGELGYELYVPTEMAEAAFEALTAAMEAEGVPVTLCGLVALNSLRLEKGYRDFGADIDNTDTPLHGGLGFAVDFTKPDFIGRDALLAAKEKPLDRRLVHVLLDDPEVLLFGDEPLLLRSNFCGHVRSGAYGHALGAAVGLAMLELPGVNRDLLEAGGFTVRTLQGDAAAKLSLQPFYDPKGLRIRV